MIQFSSGAVPCEVLMKQIKLSQRLAAIISLIPLGSSVVDVGTDHGHIPVFLAQAGAYGNLAASDINSGPLEHARQSALTYGVADSIRFELCPGLSFPGSDEYHTIIIAGVGGELIASILEDAPWTKQGRTLILQPNSKIDQLNLWLYQNGYHITDARLVRENDKLYQLLRAEGGYEPSQLTHGEFLVHPLYVQQKDPLLPEYLDRMIYKYEHAITGMRDGSAPVSEIDEMMCILNGLKNMRKETELW